MLTGKRVSYDTFPRNDAHSEVSDQSNETQDVIEPCKWYNLVSFWLLGICTDFGYWIILTGAHDLLSLGGNDDTSISRSGRECNQLSTGVILIVNIIPNFIMKMILPFLPLWINARTLIAIILSISGFGLAASNQSQIYMLSGLGLCSLSVGIWTSSFLMYLPYFKDKRVVKAWCSGCGSSGFLASMMYVTMTTIGISIKIILIITMIIPLIIALVFWFLLEHPDDEIQIDNSGSRPSEVSERILERIKIISKLFFSYTSPYFLVFFSQYLINQGLFELLYIKNNFIQVATQVRWFTFIYLISVLISSSFIQFKIDYLWLLAFIQITNLCIMTTESIYGWMGSSKYVFFLLVTIIIWEGFVAGISYINTYRKINDEIPADQREFSMSFNSIGASFGMLFAGLLAVPIHNFICDLPLL